MSVLEMSGAGERPRELAPPGVRHDPAPDPTTGSPSTLEPEASPPEADRSRVEGANHNGKPGDGGTPPPSFAPAPPGVAAAVVPPTPQSPGGPQRSRPARSPGKAAAGRAPTTERGAASDATSSVTQAGSADPTEGNREGEADPSLLRELQAAREVIDALRNLGPLLPLRTGPDWVAVIRAMTAYEQVVQP